MPKRGTKYRELRARIAYLGMTQEEVSEAAGHPAKLITTRIVGRVSWKLEEVYDVCRVLGIDHGEIEKYFPPGGGDRDAEKVVRLNR